MNIPSGSMISFYSTNSLGNRGALRISCYADMQFKIRVQGTRGYNILTILQSLKKQVPWTQGTFNSLS